MKEYRLSTFMKKQLAGLNPGEINLIFGENTQQNVQASVEHTKELAASGLYDNIYYVNLPFTLRRFNSEYRGAFDDTGISCWHIHNGYLARSVKALPAHIPGDKSRSALVINSWELASETNSAREKLIFGLINLAFEYGITVFVYSTARSEKIVAGGHNRIGLGKLTLAAEKLVKLNNPIGEEFERQSEEKEQTLAKTEVEAQTTEADFKLTEQAMRDVAEEYEMYVVENKESNVTKPLTGVRGHHFVPGGRQAVIAA